MSEDESSGKPDGFLSEEEGEKIAESVLSPFKCNIKVVGFGRFFKLEISDSEGNEIYSPPDIPIEGLRTEARLREVLKQSGKTIEKKGYTLDP